MYIYVRICNISTIHDYSTLQHSFKHLHYEYFRLEESQFEIIEHCKYSFPSCLIPALAPKDLNYLL